LRVPENDACGAPAGVVFLWFSGLRDKRRSRNFRSMRNAARMMWPKLRNPQRQRPIARNGRAEADVRCMFNIPDQSVKLREPRLKLDRWNATCTRTQAWAVGHGTTPNQESYFPFGGIS
jgi:hypothetical protein